MCRGGVAGLGSCSGGMMAKLSLRLGMLGSFRASWALSTRPFSSTDSFFAKFLLDGFALVLGASVNEKEETGTLVAGVCASLE